MEELEFTITRSETHIAVSCEKNGKTVSSCIPIARYDDYLIQVRDIARNHPNRMFDPIEIMKQAIKNELR